MPPSGNQFRNLAIDLLNQRRRDQQLDPASTNATALRQAALNFYKPVYDIFDAYYQAGVYIPGLLGGRQLVPSGEAIKAVVERDSTNEVIAAVESWLDARFSLRVTLALPGRYEHIRDLENARWRCRLLDWMEAGRDVENKLFDNTRALAEWFARIFARFELPGREAIDDSSLVQAARAADVPPTVPSLPPAQDEVTTSDNRERVINLRNEENPHVGTDSQNQRDSQDRCPPVDKSGRD